MVGGTRQLKKGSVHRNVWESITYRQCEEGTETHPQGEARGQASKGRRGLREAAQGTVRGRSVRPCLRSPRPGNRPGVVFVPQGSGPACAAGRPRSLFRKVSYFARGELVARAGACFTVSDGFGHLLGGTVDSSVRGYAVSPLVSSARRSSAPSCCASRDACPSQSDRRSPSSRPPGPRHEVLPPRMTAAGAVWRFRSAHRAPPP